MPHHRDTEEDEVAQRIVLHSVQPHLPRCLCGEAFFIYSFITTPFDYVPPMMCALFLFPPFLETKFFLVIKVREG